MRKNRRENSLVEAPFSLTGIYVSNMLGIILLLILYVGNRRRIREMGFEYFQILVMIVSAFICCLIDPLIFTLDGRPGMIAKLVVLLGNMVLFASTIITGACWIFFLGNHLNGRIKQWHKTVLFCVAGASLALLVVNLFVPVVFTVSEENVYTRGPLYWVYVAVDCACMIDSLILYLVSKKHGGILKFFPVWSYILPVVVGMTAQSLFYGISVVWPCVAISVAGIFTSLQTESIFIDPLTGLFNRAYLDNLQRSLVRRKRSGYSCIMLDLNGFKNINDTFGHGVGDEAMKQAGEILKTAVGSLGSVIRYAGDEFIIILNTAEEKEILACRGSIEKGFSDFNAAKTKPYRLSASMGHGVLDLENEPMGEFMTRIDKDMYENKRQYYEQHADCDRRKR